MSPQIPVLLLEGMSEADRKAYVIPIGSDCGACGVRANRYRAPSDLAQMAKIFISALSSRTRG